jgi:hypothetical protein
VRLSPHTAHERGILQEMSISPAPRSIRRGQLCAFAGYLCTVSRPSPSGPSPCAQLSCAPTTMPHLTAWRASEFRMSLPIPTLHPPSHPWQALPCSPQRTQARRGRWRVLCLSLPLSAAPQSEAGEGRLTCPSLRYTNDHGVPKLLLSSIPPSISVDWLA